MKEVGGALSLDPVNPFPPLTRRDKMKTPRNAGSVYWSGLRSSCSIEASSLLVRELLYVKARCNGNWAQTERKVPRLPPGRSDGKWSKRRQRHGIEP